MGGQAKRSQKISNNSLESNTVLYKQWFTGELNVVADSLSRNGYYLEAETHKSFLVSTA